MKIKISMIGGGSYSWTYGLFSTFLANDFYDRETELCLYDINEQALNNVHAFCSYYNDKYPEKSITLTKTLSEDKALEGSDYVVVAISHGGLAAELEDHYITRRHGFYNVKGSESGIAGASRTIRHVPEFVRIARKMKRLCPKARMLNVTNPLTSLCRSVQKYVGVEAIGFCHGIRNHLEILLPYFGAGSFNEVSFSVSGVDHCSFLTDICFRGKDALQIMRDKGMIEAAWAGKSIQMDDPFAGRENQRIRFIVWDMLGCMPGLSDEHCAEFYYQTTGTPENRERFSMHYDRIQDRQNSVARLRDNIVKPLETGVMPEFHVSEERPDRVIEALEGGREFYDVMNYRNLGQVRELALDTVVETMCTFDGTGVHPAIANPLPKAAQAIVIPTALREEMFMEAAMEWDANKLTAALCVDPLVNDFLRVRDVVKELMDYNAQFLPKDF
jgi:alpha-galactosidase/6-phospho-beta-glucosidase family protein